jgi:2-oxoglutarate ferredoxin oxidoreductase subunit gamma
MFNACNTIETMNEEILVAGFGGQGVLSMGKILAYAAMMQGKETCWMPSYGPEMRGGTANVTIIVGDERINSPILNRFDTVIILNQQSLTKFESAVKAGGKLFYDSNGLTTLPSRTDITVYHMPAYEAAVKLQNLKIYSMVVLGAFLKQVPIVDSKYVRLSLEKTLPKRAHNLIPLNMEAFERGGEIVECVRTV